MRVGILLALLVYAGAGKVQAGPDPKDLKANMAAYVRIAVGWTANRQCHFLSPDEDTKLNATVEQNTLRLGAALDAAAGREKANAALGYMQQQGAAYASANYGDCGKNARDTVFRVQAESATLNDSLSAYATPPSVQ